jgi:citrate lyase beta subunit
VNKLVLSLPESVTGAIFEPLSLELAKHETMFPGDAPTRQPVHTVYGGAHLYGAETVGKLSALALKSFEEYAVDFTVLARAVGLPGCVALQACEVEAFRRSLSADSEHLRKTDLASWIAAQVYERVLKKLQTEAVEDYRIDFEDGYGFRSNEEEDGHAISSALAVAEGFERKTLPPFIGLRIKPLSAELFDRSVRTLDLFITTLLSKTGARLPANFIVTLPKPVHPAQVSALVSLLGALEQRSGLPDGALAIELMIETPQSVINQRGEVAVSHLVAAARGRCRGVHFGAYDFTASCEVSASHQSLGHPYCDFVRSMMKTSLAGTGVWLCDGATTLLPVGPHRATGPDALTPQQKLENSRVIHDAWRTSFSNIQRSLEQGFYQGWDLHPAQLPVRFAACYAYFLQSLPAASRRLKNFLDRAAQASLVLNMFDDAATGQALLNFFARGLNCGALTGDDLGETGLSLDELHSRSFVKILQARQEKAGV